MRQPTLSHVADLLQRRGLDGLVTPDALLGPFNGPCVIHTAWSGQRLLGLGRCAARPLDDAAIAFVIEDGLTVEECEELERAVYGRYQELLQRGLSGPPEVRRISTLDTSNTAASARVVYPHERVFLVMQREPRTLRRNVPSAGGRVSVREIELAHAIASRNSFAEADGVGDRLYGARLSTMASGGSVRAYAATIGEQTVGTAVVTSDGPIERVLDLYTCRRARRLGVASALLEWLSQSKHTPLEVTVSAANVGAMALYNRAGFSPVRRSVERSNNVPLQA